MNAASKLQALGGLIILGGIYVLTNTESPDVKFVRDMSFGKDSTLNNQLFVRIIAEDTASHEMDTSTYAALPANITDIIIPDNSLTLQHVDGEETILLYGNNASLAQKADGLLNEVYGTGHDPHIRALRTQKWENK